MQNTKIKVIKLMCTIIIGLITSLMANAIMQLSFKEQSCNIEISIKEIKINFKE